MIGVILLAQQYIGKGLADAATHMLGKRPEHLAELPVDYNQAPEALLNEIQNTIKQVDQGHGVLILADVYGATHTNTACRLLERGRIEMITGVNLPMLIRVINYRHQELEELIDKALSGGSGGIVCAATSEKAAGMGP